MWGLRFEDFENLSLQLWDIGGQSLGSKMLINYIKGAHAVLFCYDITSSESFANLEDWYGLTQRAVKEQQQAPFFALIGNKCDLSHDRAVSTTSAHAFADEVRV